MCDLDLSFFNLPTTLLARQPVSVLRPIRKLILCIEIHAVFFIVFRETIETSIVVAVLLALIKQTLGDGHQSAAYTKLVRQVRLLFSTRENRFT